MADRGDPPVDLEGKVKLGMRTLIGLLVAVITMSAFVAKAYTEFSDRTTTVEKHTATLEEQMSAQEKSLTYIQSRVDFLTEQAIRDSAGNEGVRRLRAGEAPQEIVK